jgi:hypothetical protein
MTGDEMSECLRTIGWSAGELGRRVRVHDRRIRRMLAGSEPVPPNLAE